MRTETSSQTLWNLEAKSNALGIHFKSTVLFEEIATTAEIKYDRLIFCCYPDSCIGHSDWNESVGERRCSENDTSADMREFNRIAEEIQYDLADTSSIGYDEERDFGMESEIDVEFFDFGLETENF